MIRMPRRVALLFALAFLIPVASAQGSDLEVTVVDADGAPVPGASIHVLWFADIHLDGPHESLLRYSVGTGSKGVAKIPRDKIRRDHVCLHVFTDNSAAFLCNHPLTH